MIRRKRQFDENAQSIDFSYFTLAASKDGESPRKSSPFRLVRNRPEIRRFGAPGHISPAGHLVK
jgi:hypothetical protein